MTSFAQALAEDRRLAILKLLAEANGAANESVLFSGLEMLGHSNELTRDNVRADLQFLADRGLITLTWFNEKVAVAKLTRRGEDVGAGRLRCEGVKKPSLAE